MQSFAGRWQRQTALAVAALSVLLTSTGCGEAIHNSAEDNRFIREPGIADKSKTEIKPLLPQKTGSSWRNRVTVRRLATGVAQNLGFETVTLKGQISLPNESGNGTRLQTTPENKNKYSRDEIFKADKRGLFLSSIEGEQTLKTTPPLPLVKYPIREGEITNWEGSLQLGNKTFPGQGYSRVRSPEEITLPRGKVSAYPVDSILMTTINGQRVYVPMTRWFAPGVGIVRYRFISGNSEVVKETVSYKI